MEHEAKKNFNISLCKYKYKKFNVLNFLLEETDVRSKKKEGKRILKKL